MAHLTCKEHKRRVVVLENGRTLHRSGRKNDRCQSNEDFMMGGVDIPMFDVMTAGFSAKLQERISAKKS